MPGHKSRKEYSGRLSGHPHARFLDTRGNTTLAIGICQRCQFKFPLGMLYDDPNIPGMKVCAADRDSYDPYRLPARVPDKIPPPFVRPDQPISTPPQPDWLTPTDPSGQEDA